MRMRPERSILGVLDMAESAAALAVFSETTTSVRIQLSFVQKKAVSRPALPAAVRSDGSRARHYYQAGSCR